MYHISTSEVKIYLNITLPAKVSDTQGDFKKNLIFGTIHVQIPRFEVVHLYPLYRD